MPVVVCSDNIISQTNTLCSIEMDRSSANAEVRTKNSAECTARFGSATCELFGQTSEKFGVTFAVVHLRCFALT